MTRSPPWTPAENTALVGAGGLYWQMLDAAVAGERYNKAELIRLYRGDNCDAAGPLAARSKQSIEFKLMNASAAHAALDGNADTMDVYGYRAMPNYQAALKVAMAAELERRYDEFNSDAALIDFDREQTA